MEPVADPVPTDRISLTGESSPAEAAPPSDLIGQDGQPVRVISFASGGFDTAMQLGVIHALLVIQGKAPDAVVGVSAGAINAVALAEVLQAGDATETDPQVRMQARVARFREVLDAYQDAPGDIVDAMLPDTFQVGAQRALQPIQLPIHDEQERGERKLAAESRSGLINLYNELMELRLSFGTLTRGVRRFLGLQAAGNIRSRAGRWAAYTVEFARTWFLIGANLNRLAPLVPSFLAPLLRDKHRLEQGRTAGSIIFRSRPLAAIRRWWFTSLSMALIVGLWVSITVVLLGWPFVLIRAICNVFTLMGWFTTRPWPDQVVSYLRTHTPPIMTGLYAVVIILGILLLWGKPWRELIEFNKTPGWKLFRTILAESTGGILTVVAILMVLPLVTVCLLLWSNGVPPSHWTLSLIAGELPVILNPLWGVLTTWLIIALVLIYFLRSGFRDYRRRLLTRYDIADSLFSVHPLRQFFVRLFDPKYYGEATTDDIVARALDTDPKPSHECPPGKLIREYAANSPPVHVGLTVADVGTGALEVVSPEAKVVNGLLAATAVVPLFPPQKIGEKLYVDGANIAREPTQAVLEMLRRRANPESTVAHVYAVSPVPFSQSSLGVDPAGPDEKSGEYLSLVRVALRGLQLQRFRDATMERRMTELYTNAIPQGRVKYPGVTTPGGPEFIRAWVVPVEPDAPIHLNRLIFQAGNKAERRDRLTETVADGCRAALQVMIRHPSGVVPCRRAVKNHLDRKTIPASQVVGEMPGSNPQGGPGLAPVCSHCALHRVYKDGVTTVSDEQQLSFRHWKTSGPAWPHEFDQSVPTPREDPHFEMADPDNEKRGSGGIQVEGIPDDPAARWPAKRGEAEGYERPLVSLLFSGGVFRGVYQVGVLNALSEVNVVPDIVAGASVGSITAGMACQTLRAGAGGTNPVAKHASIVRLAATYLALDQLVLTDRFADFIRNLTLRAAEARFSVWQADRMFRRFDSASSNRFSNEARLVTAGLERLFYLSPFDLLHLVEAFRDQDSAKVAELLQKHFQKWLDRMGVGNEILGTEPLARLITSHAMSAEEAKHPTVVPFQTYLQDQHPIFFLATVTNLTQGCLEILGLHYLSSSTKRARLLDGLLAGSAFPAVFRPRWAWEVMPVINTADQYIDGGTMDNLPLDAVAQFLDKASKVELRPKVPKVRRQPRNAKGDPIPHLLFSASLQVDPERIEHRPDLSRFQNDWPGLWGRAGRLGYNRKLNIYQQTQRNLQAIYRLANEPPGSAPWEPLNLEVVVVRPQWLCGTFGFHPMLGFRRDRQAASIAHGCATTLVALGQVRKDSKTQPYLAEWGITEASLPDPSLVPAGDAMPLPDKSADPKKGKCWLRDVPCPFSPQALEPLALPLTMKTAVAEVYRACLKPSNHQPK